MANICECSLQECRYHRAWDKVKETTGTTVSLEAFLKMFGESLHDQTMTSSMVWCFDLLHAEYHKLRWGV